MDKDLSELYLKTPFSAEVVQMFAAILSKDDVNRSILFYIAKKNNQNEKVSIIQLTEDIRTTRRVKVQQKKEYRFETQEDTLIDRKSAEKIVDKLASMSLIYYEHMTPYKFLFITHRGLQVLQPLEQERNK